MAEEQKEFTFDDVAEAICDKLVRRHPHVFADGKAGSSAEQIEAWEKLKDQEKKKPGEFEKKTDILEDVTLGLPALTRALQTPEKRRRAPGLTGPTRSLRLKNWWEGETQELRHVLARGGRTEEKLEEVGDLIFSCVNIARKLDVDPEAAVRFCNRKFESRLAHIQSAPLDLKK